MTSLFPTKPCPLQNSKKNTDGKQNAEILHVNEIKLIQFSHNLVNDLLEEADWKQWFNGLQVKCVHFTLKWYGKILEWWLWKINRGMVFMEDKQRQVCVIPAGLRTQRVFRP